MVNARLVDGDMRRPEELRPRRGQVVTHPISVGENRKSEVGLSMGVDDVGRHEVDDNEME